MDLCGFEKRKPDPMKLMVLVELREGAGLTQDKAGELMGLEGAKRRDSVRAWETGASRPAPKRRPRLIGYLLDDLRLRQDPELFLQVWDDIMVREWNWHPLSEEELHRNLPGSAPSIIEPPVRLPDCQAVEQSPSHVASVQQPQRSMPRPVLPREATPFVERKTQLDEIRALLELECPDVRWLTLTGVGGTGKTRLALKVAGTLMDEYGDRVRWVELAQIRDPAGVMPAIAEALRVQELGQAPMLDAHQYAPLDRERLLEALRYALQDGKRLLVLDNFEQVLGAAPEVSRLLDTAPGLKVLATSRAPLRIYGEHLYSVPPMEVPDPQALPPLKQLGRVGVVSLFVQAAQRALSGFTLDKENAETVVKICARLDGLPLAIELAAARVQHLSPEAILNYLDARLAFLSSRPRNAQTRQRTLRATFDWSYDLLSPDERTLFSRLSVFAGGFTLEAVDAVCTDLSSVGAHTGVGRPSPLDLLESLMDWSLLQSSQAFPPRFFMLETIREYAAERLEESGGWCTHERHATYYFGLLKRWAAEPRGPRQGAASGGMADELDNLRTAWEWTVVQGRWAEIEQAAESLARFYDARWRGDEVYTLFRQAAERLSALIAKGTAVGIEAIRTLVELSAWQGRFEPDDPARDRLAERCRELLDKLERAGHDVRRQKAPVLRVFAHVPFGLKTDRTRALLQESLFLYRALDDRWGEAVVLLDLGGQAWDDGKLKDAGRQYEESLTLFRAQGDQHGITACLHALHEVYAWLEQFENAERVVYERMELAREWGDPVSQVLAHEMEASLAYIAGNYDEAARVFEEGCMQRVREFGHRHQQPYLGAWLGHAKLDSGDFEAGCAEAERSLKLGREVNSWRAISVALPVLARHALLQKRYEKACQLYEETMDVADKLGYRRLRIFYEGEWAAAELQHGCRDQARWHLCVALHAAAGEQSGAMPIRVLPAAALWLASEEKVERATELYALAKRYPHMANSCWVQAVFGRPLNEAAQNSLSMEEIWKARERGRARDLQATVRELLDELECSAGS